jgi:hypothetical protein
VETWRRCRPQGGGPGRPETQTGAGPTASGGESITPGGAGSRFPDRSLDAAACRAGHGAPDRRSISRGPCMEDPGRDGLDPAAPSQTSPRTESGESEPLAGTTLAGSKKKARRQRAWVFFQDESGVSQRPSIRRTWAPKGKTPVLIHAFNWSKISICAALGYRWDGRRSRLFFQTREGTYNTNSLIAFLKDLKRRLRGQKVILVWDGLPAHKSRAMQEYLFAQRH